MVNELDESDGIYTLISEADRLRICYQMINRIKLVSLKNTNDVFVKEKFQRLHQNECLMDFIKRHKFFIDITALHSRSRDQRDARV